MNKITIQDYQKMTTEEKNNFYQSLSSMSFEKAIRKRKTKNMKNTGDKQINGRLTFVEELKRIDKNTTNFYYLCLCDCGNWKIIENNKFNKEEIISCGCYRKERGANMCLELGKQNIVDISNQIFGDLQVLFPTNQREHNCVIWECKCIKCGHKQQVNGILLRRGSRFFCEACNTRKSIGEKLIMQLLSSNNISFETEKTFKNCKFKNTNHYAYFDFFIDNKYIIEFDGIQHFIPERFHDISIEQAKENLLKTQERDKFKNNWCKENNIPLIRIPYTKIKTLKLQDLLIETSDFVVK